MTEEQYEALDGGDLDKQESEANRQKVEAASNTCSELKSPRRAAESCARSASCGHAPRLACRTWPTTFAALRRWSASSPHESEICSKHQERGVKWTNGSQPGGKSRSKTAIICTDSQSCVETGIVRGARMFFLLLRRLVATTLLARDRAAIVAFDRGSHHAAVSPWADGDAAWADADGDV